MVKEKSLSDKRKQLREKIVNASNYRTDLSPFTMILDEIEEQDEEAVQKLKEEYLKLWSRVFNGKSDQDVIDLIDKIFGPKLVEGGKK